MKQIKADYVIKVLDWMTQNDEENPPRIECNRYDSGFKCTLELPLINKTIIGLGNTRLEAINHATCKASEAIDEYVRETDFCFIHELDKHKQYNLEEDDNGFLSMHISKSI